MLREGTQVFLEFSIDGTDAGRVVIELFPDVKVGAQRFLDLAVGLGGVRYRNNKVQECAADHVLVEPVRTLRYGQSESPIAGGETTLDLDRELAASSRKHDAAGLVSLVVKDSRDREVTSRLMAVKGRLVSVEEDSGGERPNGTAFEITTAAAPSLDGVNLVIGRVVAGQDVVEKIRALPVVKDNSGSPFLQAGKRIGDKRANVAERVFNRPFAKVLVKKAGVVSN
ncbi:unnamed protein product [Pedinophyceae sp. YPF-701]|nr:unnamed protein product [Pedinophyceae sp. YPF-701]